MLLPVRCIPCQRYDQSSPEIVFDKLYLMKELSHTNCKRKIFYIFVYKKILYLNLGRSENNFVKPSIIIQETQT